MQSFVYTRAKVPPLQSSLSTKNKTGCHHIKNTILKPPNTKNTTFLTDTRRSDGLVARSKNHNTVKFDSSKPFYHQLLSTIYSMFLLIFQSLCTHKVFLCNILPGIICIRNDVCELCANTFLDGIFMCAPNFLVCARLTACVCAHTRTA